MEVKQPTCPHCRCRGCGTQHWVTRPSGTTHCYHCGTVQPDLSSPLHPLHVVAALGLTPFQREYMRQLASQPQGDPRGVPVTKGGRA